jgi:type IV secretion system protein TrbI
VIFSNDSSLSLKDVMPGTDATGAAGFDVQADHHVVRVSGNALLLSILSAGVQLRQIPGFSQGFTGPTAGGLLGAAEGPELGPTSTSSSDEG